MAQPGSSTQNRFVEAVGNMGGELGLSRVVVQIYAHLYLSEERVSLDELASVLKVSKATVSTNVRELERWGAVRRVWMDGSRKVFYVADRDAPRIVLSVVRDGLGRRLARLQDALEALLDEAGGGGEDRKVERVEEVLEMIRAAGRILEALERPGWSTLKEIRPLVRILASRGGAGPEVER